MRRPNPAGMMSPSLKAARARLKAKLKRRRQRSRAARKPKIG
jgi:hypothetical protein